MLLFVFIFYTPPPTRSLFVNLSLMPQPPPGAQALEEDIMGHSKDLYQAMSLGQSLRAVSCMDDKELVQARLDATQTSFIELQERCRRKAQLLQQALANAQLFGEDEVALMNWLSEVHGRLSEVNVQDYKADVLQTQHAEQLVV